MRPELLEVGKFSVTFPARHRQVMDISILSAIYVCILNVEQLLRGVKGCIAGGTGSAAVHHSLREATFVSKL
jgi:hypothetical protein